MSDTTTSVGFSEHAVSRASFLSHKPNGTEPGDPRESFLQSEVGRRPSRHNEGRKSHPHPTETARDDSLSKNATQNDIRRATYLAPEPWSSSELPEYIQVCGGGEKCCPEDVRPLGTGEDLAAEICPSPRSPTVEEAEKVVLTALAARHSRGKQVGQINRHRAQCKVICEADRRLQKQYEDLSVVFLSLRQSPLEDGRWIPPLELEKRVHEPHNPVRNALTYRLDKTGADYEYAAVYGYTDECATPHAHWLAWVDDPDNQLTVGQFQPVVEKHVKDCPTAYEEDHLSDQHEGRDATGAIWVDHDPQQAHEETRFDGSEWAWSTVPSVYLAGNLAYLSLLGFGEGIPEPQLQAAAIRWASPFNGISTSSGL